MAPRVVTLGTYTKLPIQEAPPVIVCETAALRAHLSRPWMQAYIAQQVGPLASSVPISSRLVAEASEEAQARHTFVAGASGGGKSRFIEHVCVSLVLQQRSLIVLDPKGELSDRILQKLIEAGIDPGIVTILDPRYPEAGVPGWNPALTRIPVVQAASDFVSLIAASTSSWGPRLQNILTNGLIIIGTHRLSIFELVRMLVRDDFRHRLLHTPVTPDNPIAFAVATAFFLEEFDIWGRQERATAVAAVLNKLYELLRNAFLLPLLCAERNTLDLAQYWQKPGVLIVRLDRTALGDEGTRLLGGLLVHLLMRTAQRSSGPVPVVLAIDELPVLERFVGAGLAEIVTLARSQNLRLIVACQHLQQLSPDLRSALNGTGIQVFFRLAYDDAKIVATSIAAGTKRRVTRVLAGVDPPRAGQPRAMAEWHHPIQDAAGRPLRVSNDAWASIQRASTLDRDPLAVLHRLAAASRVSRLYVTAADTGQPVGLSAYLRGRSANEYRLEGPRPVELVVRFPRPRLSGIERSGEADTTREWTGLIQQLPIQHAVARLMGGPPGVIRVIDVPDAHVSQSQHDAFVAASLRANGQSQETIQQMLATREAHVSGSLPPPRGHLAPPTEEEEDDGSLP